MNRVLAQSLKRARRVVRFAGMKPPPIPPLPSPDETGQAASDLIRRQLLSSDPCMIARFGSVELNCLKNSLSLHPDRSFLKNCAAYLAGRIEEFWWTDTVRFSMENNAGFFPATDAMLEQFATRMLDCMRDVDILGSWLRQEGLFRDSLRQARTIGIADLEPYYHADPWSVALRDQTVLVIHPFVQTLRSQYENNRERLFANPDVLPAFELKTLRAVQTLGGNRAGFSDWFVALESMQQQIRAIEFDVAILGCGAYGFPLASFIKRLGKKAVHLGGSTQILFGIRGARWDQHPQISSLYNEFWVRPHESERPENSNRVENGCYW